jgi:predicted enzyme related to lactoylglutathione lyase
MGSRPRFTMTAAVLDARDPHALGEFYRDLLGWPIGRDEPDWVTVRPPGGGMGLSIQLEEDHVAPSWPAGADEQQMQVHLDIEVDDLDAASALAEEAGARFLSGYTEPHEVVRTYADPAGHPFCLFVRR